MQFAILAIIVGALLVWAYYAPRLVATVRQVRQQRLAIAARPCRLEHLGPGDRRTDREFGRMIRRLEAADPTFIELVRKAARQTGRWAQTNHQKRRNGSLT